MLSLIGAVLIIGGCGCAGLKIGGVYQKRADTLRILRNGLNLLETEISYAAEPLPKAMSRVSEKLSGENRILFSRAAELMQSNQGCLVSEAWSAGIKALATEVPLSAEESSILSLFGQGLGNSSREEQLKNIALAREQLLLAEGFAQDAKDKNKKMWQYFGFCLGAVIALLLV